MKRLLAAALIPLAVSGAPAQLPWSDADSDTWRKELEAREQAAAILPLSPNIILGRARYADPKHRVAVLLLDRGPGEKDPVFVARDADCTPRAVLRPFARAVTSRTVVCEVTHGEVRPDMEIVLPGKVLLERARRTLPAHAAATVKTEAAATAPAPPKTPEAK